MPGPCAGADEGGAFYENEGVRVEFLEVGEIDAPGVEVPLRFQVENRTGVRIKGTLDIGGPTRGILPRNEPSQPFQVEPGQSANLELKVSFADDCVEGFYPVHAFFLLEEGRGDRGVLTRLVKPAFAARERKQAEAEALRYAHFRPAPVENVVDRFFEERRLSAMADYARSLDEGAGRAYRLRPEEGAYRVLLVPGRRGMLDGYLYFSGPKSDLHFRGLRVTMQGPAGVDVSEAIEVEEYREEKTSNGFVITHQLRLGEWESILQVEVVVEDGEVKIRCDSPDPVVEVSLGKASLVPTGLVAGVGYKLENPVRVEFAGDSPVLDVRFVQFEFQGGVRVTMGSDDALRAIRVIGEEGLASVAVAGRQWLRVVPETEAVPRLAENRPLAERPERPARRVPPFWFRRNCHDLNALALEIKEWGRSEGRPAGLILDGWQAGGRETIPPDVWPPGEKAGGIEGLSRFAQVCREANVKLVLADRYADISPVARGFQFDVVEFGEDGRPCESASGASTYRMRPDAALAYFEENWKQLQFHLKPEAAFLGGVDVAGHQFWDADGRRFPSGWVRERWRAHATRMREVAGETALLLSDGGGDWLADYVDAIVVARPGDLPPAATRVPWWTLLAGAGVPLLEEFSEGDGETLPRLSERVAEGRLPVFGPDTWMHEALRRSWFLAPVLEQFQGSRIERISREGDGQRLCLEWDSGLRVWRNAGGGTAWDVNGVAVAPGGFWVEGPGLRGGVSVVDGVICEILETAGERAIHPSAGQPAPPFPLWLRVETLTQPAEDQVELALGWLRPELLPAGCILRFYLSNPGERGGEIPWGPGFPVGDAAPLTIALPATQVQPERDWDVSAAVENAGGRRLALSGGGGGLWDEAGLVRLGRVQRLEGEIPRWEASWRTDQAGAEASGTGAKRPRVDFGWGVSEGAFRLKKSGDHWRLFPLPNQREFEVRLRTAQIAGFPPEAGEVTAWRRRSAETAKTPFQQEDGSLIFQVVPEVLVYDLMGKNVVEEP